MPFLLIFPARLILFPETVYKLASLGLLSKIVRIFQQLYEHTVGLLWDGCSLSEEFTITTGVKQDILPGGLEVAAVNVKLLLYADDIVILSDDQKSKHD